MASQGIGTGMGGVSQSHVKVGRASFVRKSSLCISKMERNEIEREVGDSDSWSPSSSSNSQEQNKGLRSRDLERNAGSLSKDSGSLPKPLTHMDCSTSSNGSEIRVAYQGMPGAFSEAAALKAYPQCVAVPCEQFEVAFKAVEMSHADKAVLPIENAIVGSVHRNYDLLMSHRLHIVAEVQMPVELCLLALPGVKKEDIQRIISHPQAFAQCENAITNIKAIRVNFDDTAGAAQLIASKNMRDAGAIASARAAELYGLNVLQNKLQDEEINVTRFLVLAREPVMPRTDRPFKTSIVFTMDEGPGVLFKALAVFALRNIRINKIESRPLKTSPMRLVDDSNHGTAIYFDYLFHIDFEASMAEPRAQNALAHLQEYAKFLRILGSYPVDKL
ncbi:hypothetical protein LUZ60_010772 [Juncus effusus]|nr:hypothetical protein LUZ60_010772 [Juncus effusus]